MSLVVVKVVVVVDAARINLVVCVNFSVSAIDVIKSMVFGINAVVNVVVVDVKINTTTVVEKCFVDVFNVLALMLLYRVCCC